MPAEKLLEAACRVNDVIAVIFSVVLLACAVSALLTAIVLLAPCAIPATPTSVSTQVQRDPGAAMDEPK